MRRDSPLAMPEFFAPLPLLAVGLMVLNDWVLKPRLHNALTGKLSDVAVCFFLPLFISALLGFLWRRQPRARILVGAAVAGLFYVAQETWKGFEEAFLAALRVVGAPLGLEHFALWSDASDSMGAPHAPPGRCLRVPPRGPGEPSTRAVVAVVSRAAGPFSPVRSNRRCPPYRRR